MTYTPDMNNGRNIFVFGSNLGGYHGAGAAWEARKNWGAKHGAGEGITGNAYALPTKDEYIQTRTLQEVAKSVNRFKAYAAANPELTFLVTAVGCGLAGFTPEQIAPMFADAPANCVLPEEFKQ